MSELETTQERSELMQKVRRENTEPEQTVRSLLWSTGARYRTQVTDLPGTPDVANKSRRKAIFVHGCFWHAHEGCEQSSVPKRNREFWVDKFRRNRERDRRKRRNLENRGFEVLVVWECELDQPEQLRSRLNEFWFDESDE